MSKDRTMVNALTTVFVLLEKTITPPKLEKPFFNRKLLVNFTSDLLIIGQKIYQIDRKLFISNIDATGKSHTIDCSYQIFDLSICFHQWW